ncbi:MAG: hypothetical protein JWP89_2324 [Schlesneria sp.]|nr:hypothetical protein [Schlesneria sp.]
MSPALYNKRSTTGLAASDNQCRRRLAMTVQPESVRQRPDWQCPTEYQRDLRMVVPVAPLIHCSDCIRTGCPKRPTSGTTFGDSGTNKVSRRGLLVQWIILTAMSLFAGGTVASGQNLRAGEAARITPQMGASLPLNLVFQNEAGRDIRLGDLFRGKPVILVPVYYKCPMLCGLELKGLIQCLRAMDLTVGDDFDVIAFSFDPKEEWTLAAQKKKHYVQAYGRENSANGWHFLTGTQESSEALCQAIGFRTAYDKRSGQYAHAACLVVATPNGQIARYLYGVEFVPREMKLALVEASNGQIGTITDQVQLFCFAYDPATGKYGLAILRISQVAGVLTAVVLVSCIARFLWLERHRPSAPPPAGGSP